MAAVLNGAVEERHGITLPELVVRINPWISASFWHGVQYVHWPNFFMTVKAEDLASVSFR
jgi:hypothetical protein